MHKEVSLHHSERGYLYIIYMVERRILDFNMTDNIKALPEMK